MKKLLLILTLFLSSCMASKISGDKISREAKLVRVKQGKRATDTLYLISPNRESITFVYHWYREGSKKWKVGEWYDIHTIGGDSLHASIELQKPKK